MRTAYELSMEGYDTPGNQISQMAITLGTVYHVTGEQKIRGEATAGASVLLYSGYRKWCGSGLADKDPAWHSELNTARFCFGFAIGYDAVHDVLTENERQIVRKSLIYKGILPDIRDWVLPDRRIHAMDSMGHNWFIVCVAMAGLAALSVRREQTRFGCDRAHLCQLPASCVERAIRYSRL